MNKNIHSHLVVAHHPFLYLSTDDLKIEKVQLIDFDFNKYCKVMLSNGCIKEVKAGYLFKTEERAKRFNNTEMRNARCINPFKEVLPRKVYAAWKKNEVSERTKNTDYRIYTNNGSFSQPLFRTSTLKKAIRLFSIASNFGERPNTYLTSLRDSGLCFIDTDGCFTTFNSYPRRFDDSIRIKSSHIGRARGLRELRKSNKRDRKRSW